MTTLPQPLVIRAIAWTLGHFVWEGAVIALIAALAIRLTRASAESRYRIGAAAMVAMLAAVVITAFSLLHSALAASTAGSAGVGASAAVPLFVPSSFVAAANPPSFSSTPVVLVGLWLAGVVVLSARLMGGWWTATRLARRSVGPVGPDILALARRVAGRLALDRIVRVLESSAVSVPMTIGWLKPVVLLPIAALSGLTPTQIEALLAHELAHVRRHDYLVNLLQSGVETLLFYHPAVWWISREIRAAREHCCDDLAVGVCDRLVYATALSDLAAMRATPMLALAATDGSLVERVRRILGGDAGARRTGSGWMAALVAMACLGAALPAGVMSARAQETKPPSSVVATMPVTSEVSGAPSAGVGGVATGVPDGVASGVQSGVASTKSEERGTTGDRVLDQTARDQPRAMIEAQVVELRRQLQILAAMRQQTVGERQREVEDAQQKLMMAQELQVRQAQDAAERHAKEVEEQVRVEQQALDKARANLDDISAAVLEPKLAALRLVLQDLEKSVWTTRTDAELAARARNEEMNQQRLVEAERKLEAAQTAGQSDIETKLRELQLEQAALAARAGVERGEVTAQAHGSAKSAATSAKEGALKADLFRLRDAIDQYHTDNGKYPESLQTLVHAGYLHAIPTDPFTQSTSTWQTLAPPTAAGGKATGVFDVKSGSHEIAMDGRRYSDW